MILVARSNLPGALQADRPACAASPGIAALHGRPAAQLWDNRSLKEFTDEERKKVSTRAKAPRCLPEMNETRR